MPLTLAFCQCEGVYPPYGPFLAPPNPPFCCRPSAPPLTSLSGFTMSVLIETSLGDVVIDVDTVRAPVTAANFLALCTLKYYNNCIFHRVERDFIAQTGDPTRTGTGGSSVYGLCLPQAGAVGVAGAADAAGGATTRSGGDAAPPPRFFADEFHPALTHDRRGVVAMAPAGGPHTNGSQFYIQLSTTPLPYLDGVNPVFGYVAEGAAVLAALNDTVVDTASGRPLRRVSIHHTIVLHSPLASLPPGAPDPPSRSPSPPPRGDMDSDLDSEVDEAALMAGAGGGGEVGAAAAAAREAHSRAVVLELVGDVPSAEAAPPEDVLFVCKLNPVTRGEDLALIFSRFGPCTASVIRDPDTGASLCYAFVEFETVPAAEAAYRKMDGVLIDDRRVKVDFSQSVARLWADRGRGRGRGRGQGRGGGGGGRGGWGGGRGGGGRR